MILCSFHFLGNSYPEKLPLLFAKIYLVTSVLKSSDSFNIYHYMPITIIPHLVKLFKSLIYSYISTNLNYVLIEELLGFRLGKVTNRIAFATYISQVIEHGGQVDVVLTNFKKAFNTVDHNRFIGELESLGTHSFPDLVLIHLIESNFFKFIIMSRLYLVHRFGVSKGGHSSRFHFIWLVNLIIK